MRAASGEDSKCTGGSRVLPMAALLHFATIPHFVAIAFIWSKFH
jgi:hypothetical protein